MSPHIDVRNHSSILLSSGVPRRLTVARARSMLSFDVSFQRGSIAGSGMGTPTVKVKVSNNASNEHVFIDPFEFTKGFSVLR